MHSALILEVQPSTTDQWKSGDEPRQSDHPPTKKKRLDQGHALTVD